MEESIVITVVLSWLACLASQYEGYIIATSLAFLAMVILTGSYYMCKKFS